MVAVDVVVRSSELEPNRRSRLPVGGKAVAADLVEDLRPFRMWRLLWLVSLARVADRTGHDWQLRFLITPAKQARRTVSWRRVLVHLEHRNSIPHAVKLATGCTVEFFSQRTERQSDAVRHPRLGCKLVRGLACVHYEAGCVATGPRHQR
jgi:hypothetical protein